MTENKEDGPEQRARYWRDLGLTLLNRREHHDAGAAFRRAVTEVATCAVSWNCLGMLASRNQQYPEAESCFVKAIEAAPDDTAALCNLATILKQTGRIDEAAALIAPAVAKLPGDPAVQWIAALLTNYQPDLGPDDVSRQHLRFAAALEARVVPAGPMLPRHRDLSSDRLRIGFLSPDMRRHSVAHFLLPLVRTMDRSRFTVMCYSLAGIHDEITALFRSATDLWRDVSSLPDPEIVWCIRRDEVDILIDCAGLFEGARPSVLAMRSAPIQLAWLGYPSDLSLEPIDCRMLDALSSPVGAECDPTDRIARIDGCFLAYDPLSDDPPPLRNPRPEAPITFGCFNDSSKWNPDLLDQWARLLHEVTDSRLLLKTRVLDCPDVRERVQTEFAARGIEGQRLELRGFVESQAAHRLMYAEIDIALDTFPYHGVTSTCEALLMGVPVVTLAGQCHAGRAGVSLMHAVGHPEWVASSFEEYRGIAGSLAKDRTLLSHLHETLRGQLRRSPLFDTHGFARRFEAVLHSTGFASAGIPTFRR